MIPILTIEEKLNSHYKVRSNINSGIKDVNSNTGVVDIVLNTYYFYDSYGDVLVDGVCKKSIKEHGVNSGDGVRKIKYAKSHDLTKLPGRYTYLEEEKNSNLSFLRGNVKMSNSTLGRDTLIEYEDEIWDNHSIGFSYRALERVDSKSDKWDKYLEKLINPDDAIRNGIMYWVTEIELYEGSCVAIGANDLTPTLGMKTKDPNKIIDVAMRRVNDLSLMITKGGFSEELIETYAIQIKQILQILNDVKQPVDDRTDINTTEEPVRRIDFAKLERVIKTAQIIY